MKDLNAAFFRAFVADAVEKAAIDDSDILWVKCDEVLDDVEDPGVRHLLVAARDNFDGPGKVRTFRVTITQTLEDSL